MKLIGITTDYFFEQEDTLITFLLEGGLDVLHLRKPGALSNDIKHLLLQIPSECHSRIVLHDHFELTSEFRLKGIHLNSRQLTIPPGFNGSISRSCHSLEELKQSDLYTYLFLSPLFNSISKQGYNARFSEQELCDASASGLINTKTIALGGVTPDHIPVLRRYGFGGIALLGYLWADKDLGKLQEKMNTILEKIK